MTYRATIELMLCSLPQAEDRNATYKHILRALCKVFLHSGGCDEKWHKLHPELSDKETRYGGASTVSLYHNADS